MSKTKPPKDMLLPLGPLEGGGMAGVRFTADDEGNREVALGEFRPVEEGKPIMGDILKGASIPGTPYVELTTEMEHPNPLPSCKASGKVFSIPSAKFEEGWERVFGANRANDVPVDPTIN